MAKQPPKEPGVPPEIQAMIDATKKRSVPLEMTHDSVLVDSESAAVYFTGKHPLHIDKVTVRVPFSALLISAMNVTGAIVVPMVQQAEQGKRAQDAKAGLKLES